MAQTPTRSDAPARTSPPARGTLADRCSIAGTLTALGDTWSIMVLRELFFGVHRFNDLQRDLGVSRSVLSEPARTARRPRRRRGRSPTRIRANGRGSSTA